MDLSSRLDKLPQHVAIIMDGNGRWAERHNLPRVEGHKKGAYNARRVAEIFIEYQIPYLTLYTFSTENWNRPKNEVEGIFKLLEERLDEGISIALAEKVRIRHLGNLNGLSSEVREKIKEAEELTRENTRMTLNLAFNYGGRAEIIRAVQHIVQDGLTPADIDSSVIDRHLFTAGIPDPDLIIRTGGEKRLSNFLLWQSAYAEIYFTSVLWPDFGKRDVNRALIAYDKRQRRFGALKEI